MNIYITGDTHGLHNFSKLRGFANEHRQLNKDDFVIIAGDFGAVWDAKTIEEDLKYYRDLPFTVLFVDGNHENFDIINSYPIEVWNGGKVHRIKPDIIHLMRGQVFEIGGKKFFTFGGATSIDSCYRIEGKSWWHQELPTYEEFDEGIANLKRNGNKVDYVITHACGQQALTYPQLRSVAGVKTVCPESFLLSNFEDAVEFKRWYFGHFHIDANLGDKYTALFNRVIEIK